MVSGRGVRFAAVGLALAACLANAWARPSGDAPSKQQIRDWIKVLDTTWGRLTPPGVSIPIELTPVYKQGEAASDALAGSPQGVAALIRYCLARHHGTALEDDLQWAAIYAIVGMSRHPIRTEGAEAVSLDELRSFLLLVPASPHSLHIRGLQKRLSIEDVVALRDVWLAWLDAVKPELLPIEHTGTRNGNLLLEACDALRASDDPSGLDQVVSILRRGPGGAARGMALRYLIELGDPRAFDLVIEEQGGMQCGTESEWNEVPWAATQDQLEELLRCRVFDFSMLSTHFKGRPDLARAVATVLAENGGLAQKLSGPGNRNVNGIPLSQVASVLETGAEALPTDQLVSMVRRTVAAGAWTDAVFWIRLLGRRPAVDGTQDLVKVALMGTSPLFPNHQTVFAANRALLRRSLMPQTADALIDSLEALQPQDRARVASGMVNAMEWLPGIPLRDPRSASCGLRCWEWDWQRWEPTLNNPRDRQWDDFVRRYQDRLLRWLVWVPDRDVLARIYPFMTGRVARRRFRHLLLDETPMAAEVTWRLGLDLQAKTLRSALSAAEADPVSRAFLLLRLSEDGDSSAYQEIKDLVLPTFGAERRELSRFQSPLLEEAARRRDTGFLVGALRRCPKGEDVTDEFTRLRSPVGGYMIQQDVVAAYLLRVDQASAQRILLDLDPAEPRQRLEMLQVVAVAKTKNAEPLLRKIEPHLELPESPSVRRCREDERCRRWAAALAATGTPWCRARLEKIKAWDSLLEQRDPQADDRSEYLLETGKLDAALARHVAVDRKDSTWGIRLGSSRWEHAYSRNSRQNPAVKRSLEALSHRWESLSLRERVAAIHLLQHYPESVTDKLLRLMLRDDFVPIRLSALQYLWRFPRPAMNSFLAEKVREDPAPWCRRLAVELLGRPIDPLQFAPASPFQSAGFGSVVSRRRHLSPIQVWPTTGQEPSCFRPHWVIGSVGPALPAPPPRLQVRSSELNGHVGTGLAGQPWLSNLPRAHDP